MPITIQLTIARKVLDVVGLKEERRTWSVRFDPDGRYLVGANQYYRVDSAVRVYAIEAQENRTPETSLIAKLVKLFPGPDFGGDLVFAPDDPEIPGAK